MVRVGKYDYSKSTNAGKKLMVVVIKNGKKKTIHFGDSNMEQFKDKTGIWSSKNHGDSKRRANYLSRSGGIKNGSGGLTKDDPHSPNYHSRRVLW
tara:strand:+ start:355 stop:639 length:285 start_codon:yes stop_codon:yes gene_type:complete